MIAELTHLKAVIEGQPGLQRWREWFARHGPALESILTRGQLLRLKRYPTKEIPRILEAHGVAFTRSDFYEWLDFDSTSGRCRNCGEPVQSGRTWKRCPNGCFVLVGRPKPSV